jgi:hypothetical protein
MLVIAEQQRFSRKEPTVSVAATCSSIKGIVQRLARWALDCQVQQMQHKPRLGRYCFVNPSAAL